MYVAKCAFAAASIAAMLFLSVPARAQEASPPMPTTEATNAPGGLSPEQLEAIQKQAQNPIADQGLVPFQSNFDYGVGPYSRFLYDMQIQPVVPVYLTSKMNLVLRGVIPAIDSPSEAPPQFCVSPSGCGSTFGIGDTQLQMYFAPQAHPGGVLWGAGPLITAPTGTPSTLGAGKWDGGIDAVGLLMPGHWVLGLVATQQWSFAGRQYLPSTNSFLSQLFINYILRGGWSINISPVITANWSAAGNQKWTVPVGGGVVYTHPVMGQIMSFQLGYYTNVRKPLFAPQTDIRFQWALIFPVHRGASTDPRK